MKKYIFAAIFFSLTFIGLFPSSAKAHTFDNSESNIILRSRFWVCGSTVPHEGTFRICNPAMTQCEDVQVTQVPNTNYAEGTISVHPGTYVAARPLSAPAVFEYVFTPQNVTVTPGQTVMIESMGTNPQMGCPGGWQVPTPTPNP